MLNIPTDLLRTLVAVVDMRSFTKAAQLMGVTQPAVSAQIKRLQYLPGYEVLDKSAPGCALVVREGGDRTANRGACRLPRGPNPRGAEFPRLRGRPRGR